MESKDSHHRFTALSEEHPAGTLRPRQAPQLVEYEVEDDLVVYDPRKDLAHILNPTAAAVWWLCDGERLLKDIPVRVAGLYGMEPREVDRDVNEILSGFRKAGLLESP